MSNRELLFHCAPTLANVKIGNIFTVKCEDTEKLLLLIAEKNNMLNDKGVYVRLLKTTGETALIYVFRRKQLIETLRSEEIQEFLTDFGYDAFDLEDALSILKLHLCGNDFPHEIGVFLGYPLEDIRGFILHGGKNCHHTGCWKVYHNPENALKIFARYKKCIKIYLERYAQGFDMSRLTVAG